MSRKTGIAGNVAVSALPPRAGMSARTWLGRLLRIEPIEDIHRLYWFFARTTVFGERLIVASWPSTRYHIYWPASLKRSVPLFNHCALVAQILRARPWKRTVLVREFDNVLLLASAPLLWWFRRNLVFNINANFPLPLGGGLRGSAMRLLARMGFRFILLDGENVRDTLARVFPGLRLATPPLPLVAYEDAGLRRRHEPPGRFTLGFVGNFRADKGGIAKALEAISHALRIDGVAVRAGFWNPVQQAEFARTVDPRVEVCSTFSEQEYHDFIGGCDALVLLAEKNAYYYRHSAILCECIGHATIPICPDYPVFRSIVEHPVPIGMLYESMGDLARAIDEARASQDVLQSHFSAHAQGRSVARVGAEIEALTGARNGAHGRGRA